MSGISITCFAASYGVALALEVTRLWFRSGIRGAIMLGFAGAGLLAHTLFLAHRAATMGGSPLSSEMDWYLLTAWLLVAVYLYLVYYYPKTPFGLALLPLALGLIGAAAFLANRDPFARGPASQVWGVIHGVSILLATVGVLLGFSAGVMYLYQARRLKLKLPPGQGLRLPSLESLQRINSRALVISMLTLGIGVLSGMNLNLINYRRHEAALPWTDPLVLATLVMFLWLFAHVQIVTFYRPARVGRKVAYITLVSFVFLVVAFSAMLLMNTQHGASRDEGGSRETGDRGSMESGQGIVDSGPWTVDSGSEVGVQGSGVSLARPAPHASRPKPPTPGGAA